MPARIIPSFLILFTLPGVIALVMLGPQPATPVEPPKLNAAIEENRFTKNILLEKMDEPLQLAIPDANHVLYIERKGKVWVYDFTDKKKKLAGTIPVSTKYTDAAGKVSEAEDGLLGLSLDPAFNTNNFVYLYYSPAGPAAKNILARYQLKNYKLVMESRKVILEVPVQREQCCHTGGDMAFDANGNLYLSTGDNTSPRATPYSPIDERKARSAWDAQKSSANTNDLRGKILRIQPHTDGSYTIPEGNLFAPGTPGTRPEIYTMGLRNPYRISVDKRTGFLYWGDVGPDSGKDSVGHGPRSYDEINQAKQPGFFGWPYFVGNNQAYWKYDFTNDRSGELFNPEKPINTSPNNNGLQELPPAQKPLVWYSYEVTKEFPQLGTGGRSAMAGPVFYKEDFKNAKRKFPDYLNGKLFIYDWMRDWIMLVKFNDQGNYNSMERFLPNMPFSHPIHMQFGPDGDLFIIEYGTGWFQGNDDARLVRLEYNGGNRSPVVKAGANRFAGATPLNLQFSSAGTTDPDNDALTFAWKVSTANGTVLKTFSEKEPVFTFTKAGNYQVTLTVTDAKGLSAASKFSVIAGNEPPELDIKINVGNSGYYFPGEPIRYEVSAMDKEDGTINKGIAASAVRVDIRYLADSSIVEKSIAKATPVPSTYAEGQRLIGLSDCKSCHAPDKKIIGPSYTAISQKYRNNKNAGNYLTEKIINGGSGVWGETAMAAHPQLSKKDVNEMVNYIMSLGKAQQRTVSLPLKGSYIPKLPDSTGDKSVVMVSARYTDKGAPGASPSTTEKRWLLKSPKLVPAGTSKTQDAQKYKLPDPPMEMLIVMKSGAWAEYQDVDLTGITSISFATISPKEQLNSFGGKIEVRLDSVDGALIGETENIDPFPGPMNEIKPAIVKTNIKAITGRHTLYFVFRNPEAKGALFIVFSATLNNK